MAKVFKSAFNSAFFDQNADNHRRKRLGNQWTHQTPTTKLNALTHTNPNTFKVTHTCVWVRKRFLDHANQNFNQVCMLRVSSVCKNTTAIETSQEFFCYYWELARPTTSGVWFHFGWKNRDREARCLLYKTWGRVEDGKKILGVPSKFKRKMMDRQWEIDEKK